MDEKQVGNDQFLLFTAIHQRLPGDGLSARDFASLE